MNKKTKRIEIVADAELLDKLYKGLSQFHGTKKLAHLAALRLFAELPLAERQRLADAERTQEQETK